jgi:hypothetical protein
MPLAQRDQMKMTRTTIAQKLITKMNMIPGRGTKMTMPRMPIPAPCPIPQPRPTSALVPLNPRRQLDVATMMTPALRRSKRMTRTSVLPVPCSCLPSRLQQIYAMRTRCLRGSKLATRHSAPLGTSLGRSPPLHQRGRTRGSSVSVPQMPRRMIRTTR